jgi:UDP-3-O-[3-hydroxymyristoyl] N-acetylglucosamine deacetylase
MGDLALCGAGGNSGVPCGHVVTYNADHELRQAFVQEILKAVEQGEVREFPYMLTPSELAQVIEAQKQEAGRGGSEASGEEVSSEEEEQHGEG